MNLKTGVRVAIQIRRDDCEVTNYIYNQCPGASIERVKIDGIQTIHRIIINSDKTRETAIKLKAVSDVFISGRRVIWAKSGCCSSCSVIGKFDDVITGTKSLSSENIIYNIILPDIAELKRLENELRSKNIDYSIIDMSENENDNLTDREKEIIIEIYKRGYFNNDRNQSLTEIARDLNISTASLSEILRKSLKKIINYYIENKI
ncbi:helix-turn-helix domain-containing protein [Picrophilus oshimae]|uniref:HTH bat-type domain-containing protein n=1 Tax=Picrophilus torridus (strain ATCC 700027 / DSM 9790 / JCM 10055 / NBRC 100828 / KAW 2/3) TaxID=1122961 RepID=A0A8G2FY15_PICTO|nr:helix-turn-helix domain-containing protein [Picrophilus oshimae]SMD31622.1 hypothetical protein SAMN02745355_1581 [Picrophilus oshimae DSM 9789]